MTDKQEQVIWACSESIQDSQRHFLAEIIVSKFTRENHVSVFLTGELKTVFTHSWTSIVIVFDFFCLFAWTRNFSLKKCINFNSKPKFFSVVYFFLNKCPIFFCLRKRYLEILYLSKITNDTKWYKPVQYSPSSQPLSPRARAEA